MKKRNAIRLLAVVMVAAMLGGAVLSSCAPAGVNDESTTEELTTTEATVEDTTDTESESEFVSDSDTESASETESEPESESVSETETEDYWEKSHVDLVTPVEETVHITFENPGYDIWQMPNCSDLKYAYGGNYLYNEDGSVDFFYATTGDIKTYWDCIGYRHSPDGGKTWETPRLVLRPSGGGEDTRSCCDPGVVYFNGYYYIGYTSTLGDGCTNNVYVARSKNATGPYEKWNGSGWGGVDPAAIFHYDEHYSRFGIGEPSFIELNGTLYIYYNYWAETVEGMMVATADATDENWPLTIQNHGLAYNQDGNVGTDSVDVKYVEEWGKFIGITTCSRMKTGAYVGVLESSDGLRFEFVDAIRENIYEGCHNAGFSSRPNGHIRLSEDADKLHITYGYGLGVGGWNLRAHPVNLSLTNGNDIAAEIAKPFYSGVAERADADLTDKMLNGPMILSTSEEVYIRGLEQETFQITVVSLNHYSVGRNITSFADIKYEVKDESVITIDENGVATIHGLGETQVQATVMDMNGRDLDIVGFSTFFYVRIVEETPGPDPSGDPEINSFVPAVGSFVIAMNEKDLYHPMIRARMTYPYGPNRVAEAFVRPPHLDPHFVFTFTGYDENVISVDGEGRITALAVGETDVTVTYNEWSFTVHVEVTDDPTRGFFLIGQ